MPSIATILLLLLSVAPALPEASLDAPRVLLAGHDNVDVEMPVRRFSGTALAIGAPDAKGEIYSFRAEAVEAGLPAQFVPAAKAAATARKEFIAAEVKSLRITILSGDLLGASYQIRDNTEREITVTDSNGPLNGLAAGDLLLLQRIFGRSPPVVRH